MKRLALILVLWASLAQAALIQPATDLVYLGAFKVPTESSGGTSASYGGTVLGFNPLGNGGAGSLYLGGHVGQGLITEISIPVAVISATKNINELNRATTLQNYADMTGGSVTGTDPETSWRVGDILYLAAQSPQTSDKYYWVIGQRYNPPVDVDTFGYNSSATIGTSVSKLFDLSVSQTSKTSRYLMQIPTAWADANVGGKYIAAGRDRINNGGSWGPALYAIAPWQDGNPPANGASLASTKLLDYPFVGANPPTADHAVPLYSHGDRFADGAWLSVGTKAAVMFYGQKNEQTAADLGGTEPYGAPPTPYSCPYGGFHGEPRYTFAYFYDPADLASVAAATMNSEDVNPYATAQFETIAWRHNCNQDGEGGVAYDPVGQKLYVVERGVESPASAYLPIIHVYSVEDNATGADTTAPTTPTLTATVVGATVQLSWTTSTDASGGIMYVIWQNDVPINVTTDTSWTDTGVVNPGSYNYYVKAVDRVNNRSAASNTASATFGSPTATPTPTATPVGPTATPTPFPTVPAVFPSRMGGGVKHGGGSKHSR